MPSTVKMSPGFLGTLMRLSCARIVFRNYLLVAAQHVHSEALSRVQVSMSSRSMIHAHQNQLRFQRYRGKRISSHPVDLAILIHGDDRHPGRETSHCPAKVERGKSHAVQNLPTHCKDFAGRAGEVAHPTGVLITRSNATQTA